MFKHRFNSETAHDFRNVIDSVNLMIGRAKSTLTMMTSYLEGDCDDLHNHDVAGVIYGVLAELDDVNEVLDAHFKANHDLTKQIEALSHIILSEKIHTPEKLDLILNAVTLPIDAQLEIIDKMRQVIQLKENKSVH